jgi:malonyl-CoA decarboxylase
VPGAQSTPSGSTVQPGVGGDRDGLLSAGVRQVRGLWARLAGEGGGASANAPPGPRELQRLRESLERCASEHGGEVSSRARAAALGAAYLRMGEPARRAVLRLLATDFGARPESVDRALRAWQQAADAPTRLLAEARLREALRSRRESVLRQFHALPEGMKFLVDLRAEVLHALDADPALGALEHDLAVLLQSWFDVGFLSLERITWTSPAALLEKLIAYEAVHEIRSWTDLRHRLESDRRCYAFFHPRMPLEPLIFVEVALTSGLADSVQALLDESSPALDPARADTAMFYSISSTQPGLRGISFGNALIKQVVGALQAEYPGLRQFATLSPVPRLRAWLRSADDREVGAALPERERLAFAAAFHEPPGARALERAIDSIARHGEDARAQALQPCLLRAAAHYLHEAREGSRPHCPVARFHLSNGARLERIDWGGDTSARGIAQSGGVMVNYLYRGEDIDENHERHAATGEVIVGAAVRRLLRG